MFLHNNDVEVRVSSVRHIARQATGNMGLFALHAFRRGDVIVIMSRPRRMTLAESDADVAAGLYADDRRVFMPNQREVVIDEAREALWYYMNHSPRPNAVMRFAEGVHPKIYWLAARDVVASEEIFFDYGDVPAAWNRR